MWPSYLRVCEKETTPYVLTLKLYLYKEIERDIITIIN